MEELRQLSQRVGADIIALKEEERKRTRKKGPLRRSQERRERENKFKIGVLRKGWGSMTKPTLSP